MYEVLELLCLSIKNKVLLETMQQNWVQYFWKHFSKLSLSATHTHQQLGPYKWRKSIKEHFWIRHLRVIHWSTQVIYRVAT